jgi:hypothetical protein
MNDKEWREYWKRFWKKQKTFEQLEKEKEEYDMTPEAQVKNKVKLLLSHAGAYYFMPATGGYGASGVPDIIACLKGKFIAIECKSGDNKPTALQLQHLHDIEYCGGIAVVVTEKNINKFERILDESVKGTK